MTSTEGTLRSPAGTSASAGTPFTAGCGASRSTGRAAWRTVATGPGTSARRPGRRNWRTPSWNCGSSPQAGARTSSSFCSGTKAGNEAPGADPWHPRRPFLRPYGVRKPKEYLADRPAAIVQVDTAHVSLFSGFHFKHFTACDAFTRWQVLEAHGRATAHAAAGFLDTILERMPFPVRAIPVDVRCEFIP